MAFIESGKTFDKEENYQKLKKKMEGMDLVQYPLRIPSGLYKQVRIKLAKEDLKLRGVLIAMLEEYVKE